MLGAEAEINVDVNLENEKNTSYNKLVRIKNKLMAPNFSSK